MQVINNESDFHLLWVAEDRAGCLRHMRKYTDCGLTAEFEDDGVQFNAIVEGSDFVVTAFLTYPFTDDDNNDLVIEIENITRVQWHRTHRICMVCEGEIPEEIADLLDGEDWMPFCDSEECCNEFNYAEEYQKYFKDHNNTQLSLY